jgi:hypothetical protein
MQAVAITGPAGQGINKNAAHPAVAIPYDVERATLATVLAVAQQFKQSDLVHLFAQLTIASS